MNERILVVDDEKAIADLVGIYLTKEGFDVQIAYSGADAAKAILEQEFDLALLDVMLPDIDGFELLRTIRSSHTYPVIMLTARDAQQDKIEGLSLGADDYVVKPFRPLELIARVHAQLRRYTSYGSRSQVAESPTIQLDGLEINRDARSVTVRRCALRPSSIPSCCIWSSIVVAWCPWRTCSARCGTRTLCPAPTIRLWCTFAICAKRSATMPRSRALSKTSGASAT